MNYRSGSIWLVGAAGEMNPKVEDIRMGHPPSQAVDEIIAVGKRSPLESKNEIGKALLYFPEPKAQAAADELIQDKKALALWRAEAKSKGTKAIFPY